MATNGAMATTNGSLNDNDAVLLTRMADVILEETSCSKEVAAQAASSVARRVLIPALPDGDPFRELLDPGPPKIKVSEKERGVVESLQTALTALLGSSEAGDGRIQGCASVSQLIDALSQQASLSPLLNAVSKREEWRVFPLVDYLCAALHLTLSEPSPAPSQPDPGTLDKGLGVLLDILLSSPQAANHAASPRNAALISALLPAEHTLASNAQIVVATFLLVRGRNQRLSHSIPPGSVSKLVVYLSHCAEGQVEGDGIMGVLLAINAGFSLPSENALLRALMSSPTQAQPFIQRLIGLYAKQNDPLERFYPPDEASGGGSVLKALLDICQTPPVFAQIYTTDVWVIWGVGLSAVETDLAPGSQARVDTLSLLELLARHAQSSSHGDSLRTRLAVLCRTLGDQMDCLEEALIARTILSHLAKIQSAGAK